MGGYEKEMQKSVSYICGCTKFTTERTTQQKTQRIQKSWEHRTPVHNTHMPKTRHNKNA